MPIDSPKQRLLYFILKIEIGISIYINLGQEAFQIIRDTFSRLFWPASFVTFLRYFKALSCDFMPNLAHKQDFLNSKSIRKSFTKAKKSSLQLTRLLSLVYSIKLKIQFLSALHGNRIEESLKMKKMQSEIFLSNPRQALVIHDEFQMPLLLWFFLLHLPQTTVQFVF